MFFSRCDFTLSFGAHAHFNFSAPSLLYLAIVATICSFLLLILFRSAMPRVRLARRDFVGDAPLSLLAHAHATTSMPWLYQNLSMSLITSLLLKLALIHSCNLYNDYWRWSWSWSSRQFSYWETSERSLYQTFNVKSSRQNHKQVRSCFFIHLEGYLQPAAKFSS